MNRTKNNLAVGTQGAVSPFHTDSQPPGPARLDMQYGEESADDKSMGTSNHKVKCCCSVG